MPTHAEQKVLPYAPEKLFDLVADVKSYPEFLPWCVAARIKKDDGKVIVAELAIGYKVFRERFTSRVTLTEPGRRIDVEYLDGPFRYLNNHWIFDPHRDGTLLDFYIDFEFHSKLLQKILQPIFNEIVARMVHAFEKRAEDLYGKPSP